MNMVQNLSGTIPEAVFAAARRWPDRTAAQIREEHGFRRCSFRQLLEQAEGIVSALRHHGLQKGDRVALLSENRPEWLIAYMGIVASGCIVIPLDIQMTSEDLARLLIRSGAQVGFVSATTWPLFKQAGVLLSVVSFDRAQEAGCISLSEWMEAGQPDRGESTEINREDVAAILYTSGTTGDPKGVCLTHRNLLSNAESMMNTGLGKEEDQFLGILPLHHAYPFMATGLIPLLLGAGVTFLPSLKGPLLLQCLKEANITILVGVPQVFAMMNRAISDGLARRPWILRQLLRRLMGVTYWVRMRSGINLGRSLFGSLHRQLGPSLRLLVSGGARLDPEVAQFFWSLGFTLLEGYGLTETAPVVTFTSPTKTKPGSVGLPISGVTVRIMNADSTGTGEVTVAGPNVMLGYDGDPAATAEAIHDGWFHTGDLGYLDDDGYLFLTGRAKELIVTAGGKNILPEELESIYRTSPAIGEICVVGVTRAGEGGASLHAVVVPNFDYIKSLKVVDIRQLIKTELTRVGQSLPSYQRMSGLTIVRDPLPRTRLEKLQRHRVAAMIEPGGAKAESTPPPSAEDLALMENEVGRVVVGILQSFIDKDRSTVPSDHLDLDLGFDSLRRVELVSALEQRFGRLPESLAHEVMTVRELIEQVREAHTGLAAADPTVQSWAQTLSLQPPAALRDFVLAPRTGLQRLIERGLRAGLLVGFRKGFDLRITGSDHLMVDGPCLLAANHASLLDPLVIFAAIPEQLFARLYSIGWQPFFQGALLQWVAHIGRMIPVGPQSSLVSALQAGALVVRHGGNLLIFPEGQRSVDGSIDDFRPGIGILACELLVPVLPLRIDGSFQAMPVGSKWPHAHPISLSIGPPVHITRELVERWREEGREPYLAATVGIREAIMALDPTCHHEEESQTAVR